MIDTSRTLPWVVRLVAPLVYASRARRAQKLLGFASTEAGSALDMLKAAELEICPELRRLFFQHALDEARHAQMFEQAAHEIDPAVQLSPYARAHADRQSLYQTMPLAEFLAFCVMAERAGQSHFAALARHFGAGSRLGAMFLRIEKDERFHVRYAQKQLRKRLRPEQARRAMAKVRLSALWQGWRRLGRRLGDVMAKGVLAIFYVTVFAPFALLVRARPAPGWTPPAAGDGEPTDPRVSLTRQF